MRKSKYSEHQIIAIELVSEGVEIRKQRILAGEFKTS
jgi:stress response protein YsnF